MHHQNLVCFVVGVMILDPDLSRMYYVLDDNKVKNQESGYTNAIAVPAEELFVEEKEPVLPLKSASETALASFGDAKLEDMAPLDIPFSSITQESKSPRNECITLDRIIKYGATPGCRACACSSEHTVHDLICRACFNALIRADRIASRTKTPVSPRPIEPQTPLPVTDVASAGVEERISDHEREATDEPVQDADAQLPFSAGIPPGESEPALINRVASTIDEAFV